LYTWGNSEYMLPPTPIEIRLDKRYLLGENLYNLHLYFGLVYNQMIEGM